MSEPLEDVQDAILDRLHRGDTIDRDAVLAAHPEHETALREFFRVLDVIEDAPAQETAVPASLGEFRIVRELGRGGMGVVYEAEQSSLKRRVALKVLPQALRTDPRLVMRFRREAEAAGKLRHPGIVPVYSVGEVAGTPFFAMELVQGRSLDAIVRDLREGRDAGVPPAGEPRRRWVLETVAKVADALDYAHSRGILHRDVKPGNVILDSFEDGSGAPRLTDFGLALDVSAPGLTMAGEVFGSIHYMSPEQAVRRESPIDARTDVYSLAVTLYELLTLRLPYEGTSSAELLTALTLGRLVPIRDADPSIPQPLADVVMHALRREPPERYASAAAFAADLRAVLAGTPPSAPPPEPVAAVAPAARPGGVRRNPRDKHRDVRRTVLLRAPWPVKVLAVFVALLLWAGMDGAFSGRGVFRGGPAGVGGTAAAPGPLTYDDLESLAATADPAVVSRAFSGRSERFVQLRPVISRKDLGTYRCGMTWEVAHRGRLTGPVAVIVAFDVSVDQGPWQPAGTTWTGLSTPADGASGGGEVPDRISVSCTPALGAILGDSLAQRSVTLQHRTTVWVARAPEGWDSEHPEKLTEGRPSAWWHDDARSFAIYDDYPADYPAVVTGEADAAMRGVVTPASGRFTGVSVLKDGRRSLDLFVEWRGAEGPLPVACEVGLSVPGHADVVGTAEFTWYAATRADTETGASMTRWTTLQFVLPDGPVPRSPDEQVLLLALDSGEPQRVHLAFRPSRRVALTEPTFSRYWGGTADLDLEVVKGTNSIRDER